MKRRKGILSLLFASTLLVACGGTSESEGDTTQGGNAAAGETELRMAWWGNDSRHQSTLDAIKAFEDVNDGVVVKSEYNGYASYQEKLTTQLGGNTEPDIMQIDYGWLPIFSKTGEGFYDLNTLSDVIDLSQYEADFLELGEVNGKLNGIPVGKNTLTLIVNKTVYDNLGLDVPTTWDDFIEAAEVFPDGSFPIVTEPRLMVYLYLQQKTGESLLSIDNELNYTEEDFTEGLTWYMDMVNKGVFGTRQDYLENVGSTYSSLAQNQKFMTGEYGGTLEWSGAIDAYDQTLKAENMELQIVNFPQIEGSKVDGTISKPNMFFSISKNTKNPETTAQLINFLLNEPEGVNALGLSRGIPASKKAVSILEDNGLTDTAVKVATELGEKINSLPMTPNFENATIMEIFRQYAEAAELNTMTIEEAAEAIFAETTEAVEALQ